jgi:hypothetical protein
MPSDMYTRNNNGQIVEATLDQQRDFAERSSKRHQSIMDSRFDEIVEATPLIADPECIRCGGTGTYINGRHPWTCRCARVSQ